jgi:hypothetical protein
MNETRITLPELALVAGTRAALGIGVGLLLANRLTVQERKGAGWALFLVGALSTVPLAIEIFGRPRWLRLSRESERVSRAPRPEFERQQRESPEFAFG